MSVMMHLTYQTIGCIQFKWSNVKEWTLKKIRNMWLPIFKLLSQLHSSYVWDCTQYDFYVTIDTNIFSYRDNDKMIISFFQLCHLKSAPKNSFYDDVIKRKFRSSFFWSKNYFERGVARNRTFCRIMKMMSTMDVPYMSMVVNSTPNK